MMVDIEDLFTRPYWVIDILPKQVSAGGDGQYFAIEKYLLASSHIEVIYQKFANLLLKLNCYHDIAVCRADGDEWIENPASENLEQMILERKPLNILLKGHQTLISVTGDDHYMTLYNSDKETLDLLTVLATAEGLHVWKPLTT